MASPSLGFFDFKSKIEWRENKAEAHGRMKLGHFCLSFLARSLLAAPNLEGSGRRTKVYFCSRLKGEDG